MPQFDRPETTLARRWPADRLIPGYGPGRESQTLRASWDIETEMAWSAYAAWVVAQLPEFRVRANDGDGLRMFRPMEGDVYTLTFRRKPAAKGLVEVTFEAQPF